MPTKFEYLFEWGDDFERRKSISPKRAFRQILKNKLWRMKLHWWRTGRSNADLWVVSKGAFTTGGKYKEPPIPEWIVMNPLDLLERDQWAKKTGWDKIGRRPTEELKGPTEGN